MDDNYLKRLKIVLRKEGISLITSSGVPSITSDDLLECTRKMHGNWSDFEDGNISERIMMYGSYELKDVEIDEGMKEISKYYEVHKRTVEKKRKEMEKDDFYFPIILHPGDIVDGVHRLNAIIQLGKKHVHAFAADESDEIESCEDE